MEVIKIIESTPIVKRGMRGWEASLIRGDWKPPIPGQDKLEAWEEWENRMFSRRVEKEEKKKESSPKNKNKNKNERRYL